MDVTIVSTDTDEIDASEVLAALDAAGYYVASITITDRHGKVAFSEEY